MKLTKSDAKRLLLVGALLLMLLGVITKPAAWAIVLMVGAVCVGAGISLYYWECRKEQQYRVNCLKYGNPA